MEKLQARKKVYLWLLILLSLCALIPLAVLSKYNHQSGDDYGYAYRTFQIWRETHSFWNVIKEAFATSAEFYQKWQGLYASGGSAGAGTGNFRRQILRADRNPCCSQLLWGQTARVRFISFTANAAARDWRDLLPAVSCRFL